MENQSTNSQVSERSLNWKDIERLTQNLANQIRPHMHKFDGIYGIPRGGIPVAVALSQILSLPILETPTKKTLIVDDVCDSGKTLSKYPDNFTAVLIEKPLTSVEATFSAEGATEWIIFPWESKEVPGHDSVTRILQIIGEDPNREGLLDTPKRVTKSWKELFGGYKKNPKEVLGTTFDSEGYHEMVILRDIEMFSTCEHHMLPFFGKVHIAYIPGKRVVGLSKLARLVEVYARRLQIQERLTQEIGDAIQTVLKPKGVAVVIEAKHFCMVARGIGKQNSVMTTSHLTGAFFKDPKCRSEFMRLIRG